MSSRLPLVFLVAAVAASVSLLPGCSHITRHDVDVVTRRWLTDARTRGDHGASLPPELMPDSPAYEELRAKSNLGVCFSGGGNRAAAAAIGQLRALERLPIDVPTLTDGCANFNFNAVALAGDGTLYASVMSLGGGPAVVVDPPLEHAPAANVERGALYVWRQGWPAWRLVVKDLAGANGIALSADESRLFVNSAGSHRMLEFQRETDGRLAAQYVTHMLPPGSAPDNLKLVSDGRLVATGTPCGIETGFYLLFENCLGVSLGTSPTGIAWAWSPTNERPDGVELLRWPRTFVGPSTTIRLGDWWLGSQMVDDAIAYRPVGDR